MNTKKSKNKNKQKPANPNPLQKEEIEEKIETKVSSEIEERVPEIISEVTTQVTEKISECETPKKPKRNRGKKKNADKEDDNNDQKEDLQVTENKAVEEKADDIKLEAEEKEKKQPEIINKLLEVSEPLASNITPTTRKKKNKNKKNLEPIEGQQSTAKTEILSSQENLSVPQVTEPQNTELKNKEAIENEPKTLKKKNKKKKRNDSERSEETLAVTAAFQKLLEVRDDKKEKKQSTESQLFDNKDSPETRTQELPPISSTVLQTETLDTIPKSPEPLNELSKSNKKNKKDKKHRKTEIEESLQKPEVEFKEESNETDQKVTLIVEVKSEEPTVVSTTATKTKEYSEESKEARQETPTDIKSVTRTSTLEALKDDNKSKKKNKKDKKQRDNHDSDKFVMESIEEPEIPENIPQQTCKVKQSYECDVKIVASEEKKDEISPNVLSVDTVIVEREKSPIVKVKIAKPVKKKGKEKPDGYTDEENIVMFSPQSPQSSSETQKSDSGMKTNTSEIKDLESKLLEIIPEIFDKPSEKNHEETESAKMMQKIDIPEHGASRKKSPKPSKDKEKSDGNPESTASSKNPDFSLTFMKTKESEAEKPDGKPESVASSSKDPDITSTLMKTAESEVAILSQYTEIETEKKVNEPVVSVIQPEISETTSPEELEMPSNDNNSKAQSSQFQENKKEISTPVMNSNKKRKKSPKPPKNKPQEKDIKEAQFEDNNKTENVKDDETLLDESSTVTSPTFLQEIEIRSVKTEESEGSICDITPDIQYPRSSSEVDDNNNTSIHEITTDSVTLNIPTTSPIIQGSGETPLVTPEISLSNVVISEIQSSSTAQREEKTDLKSKVMEVNKDMEELRKSIERSLAEFTAIEKCEEQLEKQFEDAQKSKSYEKVEQKSSTSEELQKTGVEKLAEIIAEQTITTSKATATEIVEKRKNTKEQQIILEKTIQIGSQQQNIESPETEPQFPPIQPPPRRDNKGKGKSKKKGKQEAGNSASSAPISNTTSSTTIQGSTTDSKDSQEAKKEDNTKQESKTEKSQGHGKQQSDAHEYDRKTDDTQTAFEPIEAFEDAMTSSTDAEDVNKSFEIISREANNMNVTNQNSNNPEISVTAPVEDDEKKDKQAKRNQISPSKNFLGHPDIPVRLNKPDYKKEKNKTPNTKQARVKIKDDVPIEVNKHSKESQTVNRNQFLKDRKSTTESITCMTAENEDFVYKYSFRKVFLPNACHICKNDLHHSRVPCGFCNLIFYCSPKHKDEDYQQHQGFCFAVSTIGHLKDQKHIYADSQGVTGHDYRLLRMQMIVSCEKVLKRKLHPWEQEALLYPRLCADVKCREWRQGKLKDCKGCGQISYCTDHPDHLPPSHQRWCKSYMLYHKLVCYQQTKGRLEPKLPTRVMKQIYQMPEKFNEVLASMYEEKIDMNDIQYAALTQIATAPLTAAYSLQIYTNQINGSFANGVHTKSSFTIHLVGAELQFEADALNKWELFFLHLRTDITDLRVVLIGQELNPSNLPLDLLGKIKLCDNCRQNKRRVIFDFQDKKSYQDYWATDFITPDLVCAFNPSIQRSSIYNGKDSWPATIKCITKLKVPFVITSYTLNELVKDLARIKSCSEVEISVISEPKYNAFASVRPDRNFISDDEIPLLFKNYCFAIICGVL